MKTRKIQAMKIQAGQSLGRALVLLNGIGRVRRRPGDGVCRGDANSFLTFRRREPI